MTPRAYVGREVPENPWRASPTRASGLDTIATALRSPSGAPEGGPAMRRVLALGSVAMLLAALLPASTSAAESTHIKLTRTGAIVSFAEIRDGLWVTTELSASSEASRQIETGPFVFINQAAYEMDEDGNQTAIVWTVNGSTTDFAMSIANGLTAATVDIPAMS